VVIPRAVREALELEPGEKLRVVQYGERIELIPVRKLKEMRGFLRGMDTALDRRRDRL
jgi:AbrB family looped-hinge helix DNA binding protein